MHGKNHETNEIYNKTPLIVEEGLFDLSSSPSGRPCLIGSHCCNCGETFFPPRRYCRKCASDNMEEIQLSRTGKLYAFTTIREKLPGSKVQYPSLVGIIELPEGEKIRTLLVDCDHTSLRIGDDMELVIDTVYEDEAGRHVLGWKFRPLRRKDI